MNDCLKVLEASADFVPQLETLIENQTKNYLVMKWVSLIADWSVAMVELQDQLVTTHYLVAAVVSVDCSLLNWKYSHWSYSVLQPLLLAFAAFSSSS